MATERIVAHDDVWSSDVSAGTADVDAASAEAIAGRYREALGGLTEHVEG